MPVFLHVVLLSVIGTRTVRARIAAVKGGKARLKEIALNGQAWPDEVLKLSNNFNNQFQVPMVWYACCGFSVATGLADWVGAGLAWLFLASRVAHSIIHTGGNTVVLRMRVFLLGYGVMTLQWLWLALRLYVIG